VTVAIVSGVLLSFGRPSCTLIPVSAIAQIPLTGWFFPNHPDHTFYYSYFLSRPSEIYAFFRRNWFVSLFLFGSPPISLRAWNSLSPPFYVPHRTDPPISNLISTFPPRNVTLALLHTTTSCLATPCSCDTPCKSLRLIGGQSCVSVFFNYLSQFLLGFLALFFAFFFMVTPMRSSFRILCPTSASNGGLSPPTGVNTFVFFIFFPSRFLISSCFPIFAGPLHAS